MRADGLSILPRLKRIYVARFSQPTFAYPGGVRRCVPPIHWTTWTGEA